MNAKAKRRSLISVGDVARRFGVSPSTIRNWEEAGIVPLGMRLEPSGYRVWFEDEITPLVGTIRPGVGRAPVSVTPRPPKDAK